MFCVSKTRGVSSPFICYRFGKISKYIFTTGYANVTAYKKRACSPPNMANPAKRFALPFRKKAGGQSENFAENQPDTIRSLTLTLRRYIAPGRTRLQGIGGTQSVPRKKAISPYWKQSISISLKIPTISFTVCNCIFHQ